MITRSQNPHSSTEPTFTPMYDETKPTTDTPTDDETTRRSKNYASTPITERQHWKSPRNRHIPTNLPSTITNAHHTHTDERQDAPSHHDEDYVLPDTIHDELTKRKRTTADTHNFH